jgi:hypothetical protein
MYVMGEQISKFMRADEEHLCSFFVGMFHKLAGKFVNEEQVHVWPL